MKIDLRPASPWPIPHNPRVLAIESRPSLVADHLAYADQAREMPPRALDVCLARDGHRAIRCLAYLAWRYDWERVVYMKEQVVDLVAKLGRESCEGDHLAVKLNGTLVVC